MSSDDFKMDVCLFTHDRETKILSVADHHGLVSPSKRGDHGLLGVICNSFVDNAVFMYQHIIGVNVKRRLNDACGRVA